VRQGENSMVRHTGLTNLELAENPTWVIALTFSECPFCGFLSGEPELDGLSVPCPKCNRSGSSREAFPDLSCIRWLEMIGDAYVRANTRTGEKQAELVEIIRSDVKRDIEPSRVAAAASDVRRFLRKSRRSETDYDRMLSALQTNLSLDRREDAARVHSLLVRYFDTVNEHTNVVVLTGSLFERLFHNLLVQLLARRGMTDSEARKTVGKRRRREDSQELFWIATGTRLQKAVGEFGVPTIYEDCQSIADRRNKFLHITPGAISAEMAERAFDIAKNAFDLFAFLQNKYCVAKIPGASA